MFFDHCPVSPFLQFTSSHVRIKHCHTNLPESYSASASLQQMNACEEKEKQ